MIGDKGDDGFYFDPAPFSQPRERQAGQHRPEPVPRTRELEHRLLDLPRLPHRRAPAKRIEFRTEVFNLTNTPMWGRPNSDVTSNNFGRTTAVGDDNAGLGNNGNTRDAGSGERQIRFGLRFQF